MGDVHVVCLPYCGEYHHHLVKSKWGSTRVTGERREEFIFWRKQEKANPGKATPILEQTNEFVPLTSSSQLALG